MTFVTLVVAVALASGQNAEPEDDFEPDVAVTPPVPPVRPVASEPNSDPPVPRIGTNPTYWSKSGWRDMRWGMGPADAVERLGNLKLRPDFDERRQSRVRWLPWANKAADPIAGSMFFRFVDPDLSELSDLAELRFGERGLRMVVLTRDSGTGSDKYSDAVPHFESARKKLAAKHGKPTCREFVDGRTCEWRKEALRIRLRLSAVYANLAKDERFTNVSLQYADPTAPDPDDERLTTKDTSVRTDPRTWSELGIKKVRLGMGLGDAIDRVLGERTWNKLGEDSWHPCDFACKKSGRDSNTAITCKLKSECAILDDGGLEIETLAFTASGRLSSARFSMESRSRAKLDQQLQEVSQMLVRLFPNETVRIKPDSIFAWNQISEFSGTIISFDSKWRLGIELRTKRYAPPPDRKIREVKGHATGVSDI